MPSDFGHCLLFFSSSSKGALAKFRFKIKNFDILSSSKLLSEYSFHWHWDHVWCKEDQTILQLKDTHGRTAYTVSIRYNIFADRICRAGATLTDQYIPYFHQYGIPTHTDLVQTTQDTMLNAKWKSTPTITRRRVSTNSLTARLSISFFESIKFKSHKHDPCAMFIMLWCFLCSCIHSRKYIF